MNNAFMATRVPMTVQKPENVEISHLHVYSGGNCYPLNFGESHSVPRHVVELVARSGRYAFAVQDKTANGRKWVEVLKAVNPVVVA